MFSMPFTKASTIAAFAAKFGNVLDKKKNVVSSPISVETLLALLTLGSTDPAHSELLSVLGFENNNDIRNSFSKLSSDQKSVKGVTLTVANKVCVMDKGYKLNVSLENDAIKVFNTAIEKINFANGSTVAAMINQWVGNITNNRITDVVSPDAFNEYTRMVLINAIYFKGTWKLQFNKLFTKPHDFQLNSTDNVKVDMMYMEATFKYRYSDELEAQLLEMPYEGDEASMLFVLPKHVEGLDAVLQKLADGHDLMYDVNRMYSSKAHVSIPKFKIVTEIDVKNLLQKLGVGAIFKERNSGLTKLLDCDEELYVSKALQKAFIEVNEEGAEAAAVTVVHAVSFGAPRIAPDPVIVFKADRPFLVMIMIKKVPIFLALYIGKD